ncbi:hypothetical protein Tco_1194143 [Tanacetum coccineum]
MSSMQEDIQCAGSDTRPPMLDRTDFESWQQRIRLYCLGKDNGENIMKSIKEGPFHMGNESQMNLRYNDEFVTLPSKSTEKTIQGYYVKHENVYGQSDLQDSDYFKCQEALMQAQERVQCWMKKQTLFLAGNRYTNVDDELMNSPRE